MLLKECMKMPETLWNYFKKETRGVITHRASVIKIYYCSYFRYNASLNFYYVSVYIIPDFFKHCST